MQDRRPLWLGQFGDVKSCWLFAMLALHTGILFSDGFAVDTFIGSIGLECLSGDAARQMFRTQLKANHQG